MESIAHSDRSANPIAQTLLLDSPPPIPDHLLPLLSPYLVDIIQWANDLGTRQILAENPDHPLVLIAQYYDPLAVIQQCAPYYHSRGPGCPPTYSVAMLVKAEIVRVVCHARSHEDLEDILRTNEVARWFIGASRLDRIPGYSTLRRFHLWWETHHPDGLFRDVQAFLDRVDPEDPVQTPLLVDTFGMETPAARQAPAVILMRLTAQLGRLWERLAPPHLVAVLPLLDWDALRTNRAARAKEKGLRQLGYAVQQARQVIAAITPHQDVLEAPVQAAVRDLCATIEKVIADYTTTDAQGQVHERSERGTFCIISATDLEATFRTHTGQGSTLGWNVVLAATTTRIRDILALTGSTPDSEGLLALLQQTVATDQPVPERVVMDKAAGHGKTRDAVQEVTGGQTTVVAHIPLAGGADPTRFQPCDFQGQYDAEGTLIGVKCPAGKVTTRFTPRAKEGDTQARFTVKEHCQDCPLWERCRKPQSKPTGLRTVSLSNHSASVEAARTFNATEEGQALLRQRALVEPVVSWLVRYQGCRRSRRVGQAAAQFQLYQAAAVRNLLLWIGRVRRGPVPEPPAVQRS